MSALAHKYPFPQTVPIKTDLDWDCLDEEGDYMIFRLTYEGPLPAVSRGNARRKDKNRIREALHPQLRRLWKVHPILDGLRGTHVDAKSNKIQAPLAEVIACQFERCGYNFVPLVCRRNGVACRIRILFLRPYQPGQELIQSGDIDNRLKVLFDALRMPNSLDEIGGKGPTEDQKPFYCLLEDDSLINHIEIETDLMLEEVGGSYGRNDVRLIMTVETIRTSGAIGAMMF